ncbi:hypothetical protein [Lysinibacter cavernae]|uniref:Putative membrane protein n=1 Tax=Lysinibacter cavernae TaxID=1640652 RepID=A0A7X5TSQ7_9MICO|nr:hypothetical protein [Lysinibacter cavernae]NIH53766.1 putative membrane protein [Lysinibacter cavernae]
MSEKQGTPSRVERVLVYMVAGIIGVSILSFIAVLVASFSGVGREAFAAGMWPVIVAITYVGLPVGFILIVVLMILGIIRRKREANQNGSVEG